MLITLLISAASHVVLTGIDNCLPLLSSLLCLSQSQQAPQQVFNRAVRYFCKESDHVWGEGSSVLFCFEECGRFGNFEEENLLNVVNGD